MKITVVDSICGSGKAQPLDSLILTENGYIQMKDIKLKDKIFGEDGELHNVIGVFPQGIKDVYEIEFSDGTKTKCCKEHLRTYQLPHDRQKGVFRTNTLEEIMSYELVKNRGNREIHQIYIPITKPINFKYQKILINPYLLGILLGDGCLRKHCSPKISNSEKDILYRIEKILNEMGMELHYSKGYDYQIVNQTGRNQITKKNNCKNILNSQLKEYDLIGKNSYDKFIPKEYLINSIDVRLELLRGLIDTDGSVDCNESIEYSTSSEQLANDIKFLAESLGGTVRISTRIPKYTYNGEKREGRLSYRVFIKQPKGIEFYSSEKHKSKISVKRQRNVYRQMRKITYIGKQECQCIMVDNPTHLYLTDNCIVTHNTARAIQEMNSNLDKKYIYITPFLDEIQRIKENCTNRYFREPKQSHGRGKKIDSFYKLLNEGYNIASTHSLFMNLTEDAMNKLKTQNYTLILDEAVNVLEDLNINKKDIKILLESNTIEIDEKTKKITWLDENYLDKDLKFSSLRNNCVNGEVYYINNSVMLWSFPVNVFKAFDEIYILTFLFDGQMQKYYYDMHNIEYDYKSVKCIGTQGYGECEENKYILVDYEKPNKEKLKELINIYEGKLNDIGEKHNALSNNWYQTRDKKDNEQLMKLKDNTYNFFRNICESKSEDNMWSVFKAYKSKLGGKGYTKGFIPCNSRATNKFRHKKNLAYLCNNYMNPLYKKLFQLKEVQVNEDYYALDKIIQWIFRSQLRDDKPINVYIPSKRMRIILIKWLNNEM